jgi:serine/threonine protein kinase
MNSPPEFVYRILSAVPEEGTDVLADKFHFSVSPRRAVNIKKLSDLGRGTYGIVCKVRATAHKLFPNESASFLVDIKGEYAEKCMEACPIGDVQSLDGYEQLLSECDNAEDICMEINALRTLYPTPNVIVMYDAYMVIRDDKLYACVALELGDMDLRAYIENHMPIKPVEDETASFSGILSRVDRRQFQSSRHYDLDTTKIMAGIMRGLAAIHEKNLVHRDVKPGNIIIMRDKTTAKISDFGMSAFVHDDGTLFPNREVVYTRGFQPVEVVRIQTYGKPADVWAAGVVYLCLVMRNVSYFHTARLARGESLALGETLEWSKFYDNFIFEDRLPGSPSREFAEHMISAYFNERPEARWTADRLAKDLQLCEEEHQKNAHA